MSARFPTWLAACALVACATPRASESIPLVAVTAPTGPLVQVQLEVSDQRLADWFPERRPELVITNDVRLLIENRVEVELARSRVVRAAEAPAQLKVEILDFWFDWRRHDFMDYRVHALLRLRMALLAPCQRLLWSGFFTGQVAQPERAPNPQREAADYLERAIDAAMASADERGAFRELSAALESKAP